MEVNVNNPSQAPTVVAIQESKTVTVNQIESVSATIVDKYSILGVNAGSDKTYVHVQNTSSATWNITHNLNKKPSVVIADSADEIVYGEVQYVNDNQVTLTFAGAFSGKAYFN